MFKVQIQKVARRWTSIAFAAFLFAVSINCQAERKNLNPADVTSSLEAGTNQNRAKWVLLKGRGAVVRAGNVPMPACRSPQLVAQYMAFVMYGRGNLPVDGDCWELKPGEKLQVAYEGEYGRLHCIPSFDICPFKYDSMFSLKGVFYVTIHGLRTP